MKYRFWDIETAPQSGYYWQAKTTYINDSMQEQCTTLLCISWKDSDEDEIHNIRVPYSDIRNDERVVKKANELLNEAADKGIIIVHQNGDRFDYKKVRARNRFYGFDPLPEIKKDLLTIDTLKEARRSAFDYNRLDYLDKHLHGAQAGKVETRGWLMWRDIVSIHSSKAKVKQALDEMVEYCDGDITSLERVFNTLLPDMKLPNRLLFNGQVDGCPSCGSKSYVKNAIRYTATRAYQSYRCLDCKKRFQDTGSTRGSSFK